MRKHELERFAGIGASIAIIVSAFFVGKESADGNPVGYHLNGEAKMAQPVSAVSSCSTTKSCYLTFDIDFNTAQDPQSPPACTSSCVSFQNLVNDNLTAGHVTIDYSGADSGNYTVYFNGNVQGPQPPLTSPTPCPAPGARPPTSRPTPRH